MLQHNEATPRVLRCPTSGLSPLRHKYLTFPEMLFCWYSTAAAVPINPICLLSFRRDISGNIESGTVPLLRPDYAVCLLSPEEGFFKSGSTGTTRLGCRPPETQTHCSRRYSSILWGLWSCLCRAR